MTRNVFYSRLKRRREKLKIKTVTIHNFRSVKDVKFNLYDYSIFVGANNAGKTNLLTALRIFYEDDIKFNNNEDFPKFPCNDNESWIDIEFVLMDEEFEGLKEEYKNAGNTLRVRKYLKSDDKNRSRSDQSNIFGYENGVLSGNLFYGARNISQAKLGNVIYIPEVTLTEEALKLSGPSPLRNMINFVVERVIKNSPSFESLKRTFEEFNDEFKKEQSKEGLSLYSLVDDINTSLREWEVKFGININPLKSTEIVRNLVSSYIIDSILDKEVSTKNLGQGLQRHLIYTLLRLSSKYVERKEYEKKEFSPDLNLILFEEPEAFLHPCQQECLNVSLRSLSFEPSQQVIVSTHSPLFVSRNIEELPSLIKLKRDSGVTKIFQVSKAINDRILSENTELAQYLQSKLDDPLVSGAVKEEIRRKLGSTSDSARIEEESIRYLLWLDASRCSAFFADIVLICEGATEKIFVDYLIQNKWDSLREKRGCILDAMGKYNIHRYMNLFKELGIYHSVLLDRDEDESIHPLLNQFIENQKNEYTKKIHYFSRDIETFLGLPTEQRRDKKPLNVMWHYIQGRIDENKIAELRSSIEGLLS